jgi:hypothetical protein
MVDKKANHEELRESNQRESAHDYQKSPDPTSQVSRARPGVPVDDQDVVPIPPCALLKNGLWKSGKLKCASHFPTTPAAATRINLLELR